MKSTNTLSILLRLILILHLIFQPLRLEAALIGGGGGGGFGIELPSTASLMDRVLLDVAQGALKATISAGVSTAINGGNFDESLVSALRLEAAATLGENVAQEIGTAFHGGDIGKTTQLIAHAALGCATGAIVSGGDGCGSGAGGAVIGEIVGDLQVDRIQNSIKEKLESGKLTQEEAIDFIDDMRAQGVDIARLASGLGAAIGGGDASIAASAGGNAAENNALGRVLINLLKQLLKKPQVAKEAVKDGEKLAIEAEKSVVKEAVKDVEKAATSTVDDILKNANKASEQTKGRTTLYDSSGGFNKANADFDALNLSNVKPMEVSSGGTGRVGTLPDGRNVIVRETSKGDLVIKGPPTLEIQGGINGGKSVTKIRY